MRYKTSDKRCTKLILKNRSFSATHDRKILVFVVQALKLDDMPQTPKVLWNRWLKLSLASFVKFPFSVIYEREILLCRTSLKVAEFITDTECIIKRVIGGVYQGNFEKSCFPSPMIEKFCNASYWPNNCGICLTHRKHYKTSDLRCPG